MDNKEINKNNEFVRQVAEQKYEFGFTTDVHTDIIDVGLNEDVVRLISQKKGEPDWMLDFRLKAYNYWKTLEVFETIRNKKSCSRNPQRYDELYKN